MKRLLLFLFMLVFAFSQPLISSDHNEDVHKNFEILQDAYKLDRQISEDYTIYETSQIANQMDYEATYGPSDSEIKSLDFISLYHIDMKLIPKKIKMSKEPLIVQLDETINIIAKQYGVDPRLVKAIIRVESYYDPKAKSHAGACGLMQLMPRTAKRMGVKDIFNPVDNLIGGIKYLKYLKKKYKYEKLVLAAYNAGPASVRRHRGVPPFPETIDYIRKVRKFKKEIDV